MSRCSLSIEVDRLDRVYRIGDAITAKVRVDVDKAVTCDGLELALTWHTHGRGNRDQEKVDSIIAFRGEWQPGTYEYSHTFSLNSRPLTYHGDLVNIDWYIKASADIPWAIDPREELDFVLLRNEREYHDTADSVVEAELDRFGRVQVANTRTTHVNTYDLSTPQGMLISAVIVGVFLLIASLFVGFSIYNDLNIPGLLFGTAFLFITARIAWMLSKNFFASKKFSSIDFMIEQDVLSPGARCDAILTFIPKEDIDIEGMSAKIKAKESATSGSGTNRTTHTETIYEHPIAIRHSPRARKGIEVEERMTIMIPNDAAPSFRSSNNSVTWSVEAEIEIPKWPDWKKSINLTIA
jgi:hypothetical protein